MINDNNANDRLARNDNIDPSLDNLKEDTLKEDQVSSDQTVTVQGVEFTKEEIEEANKPQPNVIMNTVDHGPVVSGTGTRDNLRVPERANEASDSTDTNTGGIVAGGAKGANQS